VVAFEPVPQFRAFFEYNLARNGLGARVQVGGGVGGGRGNEGALPAGGVAGGWGQDRPPKTTRGSTGPAPAARPHWGAPAPSPPPPQIRPTVAVAYPGRNNYTVVVPQRGIWGTAGISGANIDEHIDNEARPAPGGGRVPEGPPAHPCPRASLWL
jgi:hypothetical protein